MRRDERGIMHLDVARGLSQDFQVPDDRILRPDVPLERRLIQVVRIHSDTPNGLEHMANIVRRSVGLIGQTGSASDITRVRIAPRRAPDVVT